MLSASKYCLCNVDFLVRFLAFAKTVSAEQIDLVEKELRNGTRNPINIARKKPGHLYVYGTLVSRPDPISVIYGIGYTTYQSLQYEIEQLAASDADTIYMHVNSLGGEVEGVEDTHQMLKKLAENKTLIAINEGSMDSAAYWLSSAADKIYSTSDVAEQGSIGVVAGYVDYTKADERIGIDERVFTSKNAPYKHYKSNGSKAQKGYDEELQKSIDEIEKIFIDRVATGRGVSEDYVKSKFGKGSTLLSQQAKKVKMIDGIMSLSEVYEANDGRNVVSKESNNNNDKKEIEKVDPKELLENPFVIAEIDRRVKSAETEAYARGRKDHIAEVEKAMVFINSDKYSDEVKALASSVCKGEKSLEILEAVVDIVDQQSAKASVQEKEKETAELETVSVQPKVVEPKERSVEDRIKVLKGDK